MYLTIHPLDRILPVDPRLDDWAEDVSALLAPAGTPLARWIGTQAGASRGTLVSLWDAEEPARIAARTEGSTPARIALGPAEPMQVIDLDLGPERDQHPAVLQLAVFDGPRGAVQTAADRVADRRIARSVQSVPGYCGAVVALADDGGYAVVVLARSVDSLTEGRRRLMSTELPPDEDPALLNGPDRMEQHDLIRAGRPLTSLIAGGVR